MGVYLCAAFRKPVELREYMLEFNDAGGVAAIAPPPRIEGGGSSRRKALLAFGQPSHRLGLDGCSVAALMVLGRFHGVPFVGAVGSRRPWLRKNWAQSRTPFLRWTRTVAAASPRRTAISEAENPST